MSRVFSSYFLVAVANRNSELLDVESEFEMVANANADSDAEAWPVWPDLEPYTGADNKGYTCAALNTIPARFLKDESVPNVVAEFTKSVQNFNIGGYPRVKNCDKSRATLDMNVYAAGFVLGAIGGKTPDACVAKAAGALGPIGLKLKDAMIAPNAAVDPTDFIAKLNALGPKVCALHFYINVQVFAMFCHFAVSAPTPLVLHLYCPKICARCLPSVFYMYFQHKQLTPVLKEAAMSLKACPAAVDALNKIAAAVSAPNVFTEKGAPYAERSESNY